MFVSKLTKFFFMKHQLFLSVASVGVVTFLSPRLDGAVFSGTRLQLLNGSTFYNPGALAEDGRAGGYVRRSSTQSPFDLPVIWDTQGVPSPLPVGVEFDQASVVGFGSDGTPLGSILRGEDFPAGFWNTTGFVRLPDPGNGGAAFDSNGTVIVGQTYMEPTRATIWDAAGYHLLPNLEGVASRCNSINIHGVYVGGTGDFKGFVGQNGSAQKLNYPGYATTAPFEINDAGWMTGVYLPDPAQFVRRGFVARAFSDEIYDLGVFPGYVESFIGGINNSNTIVGAARNSGDYEKALIWLNGSLTPQDLNLMVDIPNVTLIRGMEVNNAGQILVEGFSELEQEFSYYVLTPVPEAACAIMVAMCLIPARRPRA